MLLCFRPGCCTCNHSRNKGSANLCVRTFTSNLWSHCRKRAVTTDSQIPIPLALSCLWSLQHAHGRAQVANFASFGLMLSTALFSQLFQHSVPGLIRSVALKVLVILFIRCALIGIFFSGRAWFDRQKMRESLKGDKAGALCLHMRSCSLEPQKQPLVALLVSGHAHSYRQ